MTVGQLQNLVSVFLGVRIPVEAYSTSCRTRVVYAASLVVFRQDEMLRLRKAVVLFACFVL